MSRYLTPQIAALPATVPFVGPEAQVRQRGTPFGARLGANENVFGPARSAIAAMQAAAGDVWMYGDSETHDLRQALATLHGIDPAHILVGEGIDGLLGNICRLTVAPGRGVVTSDGAYPTFNFHVTAQGGTLHKVPFRDDHEDLDGLVQAAEATGATLVYLSNPDNPMGTWHSGTAVAAMAARLPETALLVLDEAYVEFAPEGTAPDIAPETENVIRLRTFSKAYGLAGARIGYAIGPRPLIAAFDLLRNHFGVNRIAQAGALAAVRDHAHLGQIVARVAEARTGLSRIATDNGLSALPSAANFVAIDCGRDGDFARRVLAGLIARGVFVRMPFVAPQDRCIRVSCGTPGDLVLFGETLPIALSEAAG